MLKQDMQTQPDAPGALSRLMKNQEDVGNAVAKYWVMQPAVSSQRC